VVDSQDYKQEDETFSPLPVVARVRYYSVTRGRLASTGLMKEWQRAQVQVPGKTVWNDSTANTELALAA
jgi:hypothetical protein